MSLTNISVPNLELIVYRFREALLKDDEFREKVRILRENNKYLFIDFDVKVFSQIWGSTNTAFDVNDNGQATVGGCAMTKAYTVIVKETLTSTYGVFVDNKPCYIVTEPTQKFFDDLNNCNMASRSEAKRLY